jgi:hypothetical protein
VASFVMFAGTTMTGWVLSILILFTLAVLLILPALSVQVPDADCPDPSVLKMTGAVQEAMPDPASVPLKLTVTFVLFQPLAFGAGKALALADGAILSIRTVTTLLAALTFPALSEVVCAVDEPEAVRSWSAGQDTMPEPPSVQVKCTVTLALYQPAAVGEVVAAATIVGAVLSILYVSTLLGALTFPALSVAVSADDETAAPSALSV